MTQREAIATLLELVPVVVRAMCDPAQDSDGRCAEGELVKRCDANCVDRQIWRALAALTKRGTVERVP